MANQQKESYLDQKIILIIKTQEIVSTMDSLSRKLFSNDINSSFSDPSNDKNETHDSSILHTLKENIQNQEKDRLKAKFERNLKNKENQLLQTTKKYDFIEKEMKKTATINQELQVEMQKLRKINESFTQKLEGKDNRIKMLLVQKKQMEEQIASIREELKGQAKQLVEEREKCENLAKEHKITMRRCNAISQQTRLKLQSKLVIKQKQQEKVQTMFEQKKREFDEVLNEKDDEIACLKQSYRTIALQHEDLQIELEKFQKERMKEYEEFQGEVTLIRAQAQEQQAQYSLFQQQIYEAITQFKQNLALKGEDQDISKLMRKFTEELIQRESPKQYQEKIEKIASELAAKTRSEKELTSKNQILQDQLAFMREQLSKNDDFAVILKSHINSMESKTLTHKSQQNSTIHDQLVNKNHERLAQAVYKRTQNEDKQNCTNLGKKIFLSNHLPQYSSSVLSVLQSHESNEILNIKPQKPPKLIKTFAESSSEECVQRAKVKTTNDFLKEQLQSKKKSLIYLMYKCEDHETNSQQSYIDKTKPKASSLLSTRKRSNSLGNLIIAKCKQQIL